MSKPCLKFELLFDTAEHRNIIASRLQIELAGKSIYKSEGPFLEDKLADRAAIYFLIWLNRLEDRNALRNWVKNKCFDDPSVRNWVPKARISWHLCSHEDAKVLDCQSTDYELVEK